MKPSSIKKTRVAIFGLLAVILSGVYYLGFYDKTLTETNTFTAIVSGELREKDDYTQRCETMEDYKSIEQCWEHLINKALGEEGVEAAFDIIDDLYATDSDCHPYAHIIGEEAYNLFSQDKGMVLTPKTYYCGYGFYHGFMENLLHATGDLEEAREFCSYVDKQLSQQVLGTEAACYHGIGHGAVDGGDPRYWGDEEAMIGPAIGLCKQVAQTDFQEYICATGVFNSIEILSHDLKYKLFKIREDPFWLCHRQPGQYKEACYTNMIPTLLRLTDGDVRESASIIENIYEPGDSYDIRSRGIVAVSVEYMRLNPEEFGSAEGGVEICRGLSERSRLPCIEGLSAGHIKYGKPEEEYIKAIEFCKSHILLEDERQVCFEDLLSGLRLWYSSKKAYEICESVEGRYRVFCSR